MLTSCSATKTGAEKESIFSRWLLLSDWASVWLWEDMSDCLCIPVPSFFHLRNGLYLDSPVLWLSFFLFPPAAHLGQQLRGCCWPWWTHPSSVQEVCDHNVTPTWFLCSDEILHQTLAKTQVLETFLFPLQLTNKLTKTQWIRITEGLRLEGTL